MYFNQLRAEKAMGGCKPESIVDKQLIHTIGASLVCGALCQVNSSTQR